MPSAWLQPDPSRVVVFRNPTLYPWRTVWQNVALGLQARGELARQRDWVDLALARALVNDPGLLILDEPLGKLDSLTRLAMQTELVALWQRAGLSVLMVTHDVEEAWFMAQRVLVMGPRPARVIAELVVDRPYPRHRGDEALATLRCDALRHFGLDASW